MKNEDNKTTNLKNKDGSSHTEDDSLIAKYEVGSVLNYNQDGDSRICILKSIRISNKKIKSYITFKLKIENI